MSKHSPGPWEVHFEPHPIIKAEDGTVVAELFDAVGTDDVQDVRNARLIAVAPDLLDIVKRSLVYMIPGSPLEAAALSVISKAEGKQ
jgi:hypothetical protein